MRLQRRALKVSMAAGAILMVLAAGAWACTGHVAAGTSGAGKGLAGTTQTVTGSKFPNGMPVEIRWDSETGPLLGTATGPAFEVSVEIPREATDGPHAIVVFGRTTSSTGETNVIGLSPASFTVTGAYQGPSGPSGPGGPGGPGESGGPTDPGTAPQTDPAATASTDASAAPSSSASPASAPAPAPVPSRKAAAAAQGAPTSSGNAVPAAAPANAAPAAAAAPAAVVPEEEQSVAPAPVGVFPAGDDASSAYRARGNVPSLLDDSTGTAGGGALEFAGVGLLAAGSLVLFGSFGILQLRRRKAFAGAGQS